MGTVAGAEYIGPLSDGGGGLSEAHHSSAPESVLAPSSFQGTIQHAIFYL